MEQRYQIRVNQKTVFLFTFGLFVFSLFLSLVHLHRWIAEKAISEANALLEEGYGVLAARTVEPLKERLVHTPDGCDVVVRSYRVAHIMFELRWAVEACLHNNIETPEVVIAVAALQVAEGNQSIALLNLRNAREKKFSGSARLYVEETILLADLKRFDQSEDLFWKAIEKFPGNPVLDAAGIKLFRSLKKVGTVEPFMNRLRARQKDLPPKLSGLLVDKTTNSIKE